MKVSGISFSNWNDPFHWLLSFTRDPLVNLPRLKIDFFTEHAIVWKLFRHPAWFLAFWMSANLLSLVWAAPGMSSAVFCWETLAACQRTSECHLGSLQLEHLGIPASTFPSILFPRKQNANKNKLRASQQKTVPVYRISVQEKSIYLYVYQSPRLGFKAANKLQFIIHFRRNMNFRSCKINSQSRWGWGWFAYLRLWIPSYNNEIEWKSIQKATKKHLPYLLATLIVSPAMGWLLFDICKKLNLVSVRRFLGRPQWLI